MAIHNRAELDAAIKAYDVRGVVGESIDTELVGDIGAAFGFIMRGEGAKRVVVGHDMRDSSPEAFTGLCRRCRLAGPGRNAYSARLYR